MNAESGAKRIVRLITKLITTKLTHGINTKSAKNIDKMAIGQTKFVFCGRDKLKRRFTMPEFETKVVSRALWDIDSYREELERQGWFVYGYSDYFGGYAIKVELKRIKQ